MAWISPHIRYGVTHRIVFFGTGAGVASDRLVTDAEANALFTIYEHRRDIRQALHNNNPGVTGDAILDGMGSWLMWGAGPDGHSGRGELGNANGSQLATNLLNYAASLVYQPKERYSDGSVPGGDVTPEAELAFMGFTVAAPPAAITPAPGVPVPTPPATPPKTTAAFGSAVPAANSLLAWAKAHPVVAAAIGAAVGLIVFKVPLH